MAQQSKRTSRNDIQTETLEHPEYQKLSADEIEMLPQIFNDALLSLKFYAQNTYLSNIYNLGGYGGYYKSEKDRYKEQLAGAKRLE